jgi:hypothetical protein
MRTLERSRLPLLERPSIAADPSAVTASDQATWRAQDRASDAGRRVQEIDRWLAGAQAPQPKP